MTDTDDLTATLQADAALIHQRLLTKPTITSLRQFLAVEVHRNTLGNPLRFDQDEWLIDIYRDDHPLLIVMKSVQVGITEFEIVAMLAENMLGRSVIYVLPSKDFRADFVAKRIDGLIQRVPAYGRAIGGIDNKGIKKIFEGFTKFCGSNIPADLKSDPAQTAIVDELDDCAQVNMPLVKMRLVSTQKLTGQPAKEIYVSNPSIPQKGIHRLYLASDQRQWHITCPACGEVQPLEWFENIVLKVDVNRYEVRDKEWTEGCGRDISAVCRKCGGLIDRLGTGHWVITNPEGEGHGYHVSQLMTSQRSIRQIVKEFFRALENKVQLQVFYNTVLGLPYGEGESMITVDMLNRCVQDGYIMPPSAPLTVGGCDIGAKIHVHLSELVDGRRKKVFIGSLPMDKDLSHLERVMRQYNCRMMVIDAMPETSVVRDFQKRHQGKVYLCRFKHGASIKEAAPDRTTGEIQPDRTQCFDNDFYDYADGNIVLPPNYMQLDNGDFFKQICVNVKFLFDNGKGERYYVWQKSSEAGEAAADHHHLASIYEGLAAMIVARYRTILMVGGRDAERKTTPGVGVSTTGTIQPSGGPQPPKPGS